MKDELRKYFSIKNNYIEERNDNFVFKGIEAIRDANKRIEINDALFILNGSNYKSFNTSTITDKKIYKDAMFLINNGAKFEVSKIWFDFSSNRDIANYFKDNFYKEYIIELEKKVKDCFQIEALKLFNEDWDKYKITFELPKEYTFDYKKFLELQYFHLDYINQKDHLFNDKKHKGNTCVSLLKSNLMFTIDYTSAQKILNEFPNIMSRRIKLYSGEQAKDDIMPTKGETNQEKAYQQLFLTKLYNNKSEIVKNSKGLLTNESIPLCMELVIKLKQGKLTGRIDDVIIDGDTCILVEVKYGVGVIGGTNGIHKHLLDIHTYLQNNSKEDLLKIVEKIYKEQHEKDIKLNKLKYYIICGYNNKKAKITNEKVKEKIDSIYKEKITSTKIITPNPNGNKGHTDFINKLNKNYIKGKYPDLDVDGYMNLIKSECPTEIWLTDENYEQFDPYNPA